MDQSRNPHCIFCRIIGGEEMVSVIFEDDEVLVPFVHEIVPTVDLDAGHVLVDPPPGLLSPVEDEAPSP